MHVFKFTKLSLGLYHIEALPPKALHYDAAGVDATSSRGAGNVSHGIEVIACMLKTSLDTLGWEQPIVPESWDIARGVYLDNFRMLVQSVRLEDASDVYVACLHQRGMADEDVVVKFAAPHEVRAGASLRMVHIPRSCCLTPALYCEILPALGLYTSYFNLFESYEPTSSVVTLLHCGKPSALGLFSV